LLALKQQELSDKRRAECNALVADLDAKYDFIIYYFMLFLEEQKKIMGDQYPEAAWGPGKEEVRDRMLEGLLVGACPRHCDCAGPQRCRGSGRTDGGHKMCVKGVRC
jgi:hypothetical protein